LIPFWAVSTKLFCTIFLVSWAEASGVLSAIDVATNANKVADRNALICLFMDLKSFMQLVDRRIKITKINSRSNPEMLSFSQRVEVFS
jgi:hypothetical protein